MELKPKPTNEFFANNEREQMQVDKTMWIVSTLNKFNRQIKRKNN